MSNTRRLSDGASPAGGRVIPPYRSSDEEGIVDSYGADKEGGPAGVIAQNRRWRKK